MKPLESYLASHRGVRVGALGVGYLVASTATCVGVGVYALTTGVKAIGDYVQDRVIALCLLAVALAITVALAWALGIGRTRAFWPRLVMSAVTSLFGAIFVFGIIAARAIVWSKFAH